MYENVAKRLRWLAFNFPHTDEPKSESDKICNCINLYCTEAADAIEELSREVDIDNEALTAMDAAMFRWIPATEKLPEDTHPVLVTYLGYNDKLPKSDMVAMCDGGDWYWYDDESKCKVAITHWMPLPQPPKEES